MPEAPTLDLTYSQMPALSERLTPLQRTLAESYQRVFMRGNRTDDLLIFSGLINEIADAPGPVWHVGVDLSQSDHRELLEYRQRLSEFPNPDGSELEGPELLGFIISWHDSYRTDNQLLCRQIKELQASEDELTGKLKDVRELLESLEFDQDKSRAILKEALGEDANIDTRPVYESIVQLFRKSQLEASTADDSSLQDELTLLKDQLAEATKVVEQHEANSRKAREHLVSVLGEQQVDAVPLADAVLMLKGRYSGACARIQQMEAQVNGQPKPLVDPMNSVVVSPPIEPKAVVHLADSPRQAQDKRNPFLRVDGIYQFQSNNPNVGWIALPNFDIPRPVLKSMLLMAVGEANTWQEICKTLSLNCDVARDVQRGFALLINKLRTKAAGAPEVDEAIDKKPVAQMLEAVS